MPRNRLPVIAWLSRRSLRALLALGFLIPSLFLAGLQSGRLLATSGESRPFVAISVSPHQSTLPLGPTDGELQLAWDEQAGPPALEEPTAEDTASVDEMADSPPPPEAQSDALPLQTAPAPPAPTPPAPLPAPPASTATPQPAPTSPAAGLSPLEQQLFEGQNAERTRAGLSALRVDAALVRIARYRASDMATKGYFSHTSPTGETAFTLIAAAGVYAPYAGENIGYNTFQDSTSASSILAAFMASPGHRANILSGNYTRVGVGLAISSNGAKYYAVVFAGP